MIKDKLPKQVLNNLAALAYLLDEIEVYTDGIRHVISMPDVFDIAIVKGITDNDIVDEYWKQLKESENLAISTEIKTKLLSFNKTIHRASTCIDILTQDDLMYLLNLGKEVVDAKKQKAINNMYNK